MDLPEIPKAFDLAEPVDRICPVVCCFNVVCPKEHQEAALVRWLIDDALTQLRTDNFKVRCYRYGSLAGTLRRELKAEPPEDGDILLGLLATLKPREEAPARRATPDPEIEDAWNRMGEGLKSYIKPPDDAET